MDPLENPKKSFKIKRLIIIIISALLILFILLFIISLLFVSSPAFRQFYASIFFPESDSKSFKNLHIKGRDIGRMTDLTFMNSSINSLLSKPGNDSIKLVCRGEFSCSGNSNDGVTNRDTSDRAGWLKIDMSSQFPSMPRDPLSDKFYHYSYCGYNGEWEINTVFENQDYKAKMATDRGDDDSKYEVGSNLNLIGKVAGCKY